MGCFEPETGAARKFTSCTFPSYTDVFGSTLCELGAADEKIVAITAAMPEGTGVACFSERFPDRFFDVGICEQHAVTFAAGLASQGAKPVVAIYSTFMQRSYDQIVHDVCLQNLNVTFCLDRGGLVGEDGATHHGVFDLSFLRHIPNLVVMAPRNEPELQHMLATALAHDGPVAIRYPRGLGEGAPLVETPEILPLGEGELLREGTDGVIVALGSRVAPALDAAQAFAVETGREVAVFDARFVKPLPEAQLLELARTQPFLLTVEENALAGGFGSAVLEFLADRGPLGECACQASGHPRRIRRAWFPEGIAGTDRHQPRRHYSSPARTCLRLRRSMKKGVHGAPFFVEFSPPEYGVLSIRRGYGVIRGLRSGAGPAFVRRAESGFTGAGRP